MEIVENKEAEADVKASQEWIMNLNEDENMPEGWKETGASDNTLPEGWKTICQLYHHK